MLERQSLSIIAAMGIVPPHKRKRTKEAQMLYAFLCYGSEASQGGWSKEKDDAVRADVAVINRKLAQQGKLGPTGRLGPTSAAKTVRAPLVTDGPFAQTKEKLSGFLIFQCAHE